ncbi:MAG: hypothetical protein K1060chlam2_01495 [Chlamydiae bacterium]|nr:hypothetical protein [Chlamydiota bacterium]
MIAPEVYRQRYMIEGYFEREVDRAVIEEFFKTITKDLNLRTYAEPTIFTPEGMGKEENSGYDAFIPLIDSGISLYVWSKKCFLAIVIFTCKEFNEKIALETIQSFFKIKEFEHKSF